MTVPGLFRIHALTAFIGLIAAVPVILFVSLNILKYELGMLSAIEIFPVHPAILLGGGIVAVLLNAWSVLEFKVSRQDQQVWVMFGFTNRPWNLAVLVPAAAFLCVLVGYVIVENIGHALGV